METERHTRRFRFAGQLWRTKPCRLRDNRPSWAMPPVERASFLSIFRNNMSILRLAALFILFITISLRAEPSPAEQKVLEAIKSKDLSVVHLWAPWCSNCQTELKNGGWLKI